MSESKSIEASGPDIETAISKGVSELGVSREEVIVEVLEEPGRRFVGLGSKLAKVRLPGMRPWPPPFAAPPPPPRPAAVKQESQAATAPAPKAPPAAKPDPLPAP